MKTTLFFSILLFTGFVSCKKDNSPTTITNSTFIDTVSAKRYYASDIIPPQYSGLYNKWKLIKITGGFSGDGYEPNFDYIFFKQNGIYCISCKDTIKGFGQINVIMQDNELTISLTPDKLSSAFFSNFQKQVDLKHTDTLFLSDPCCDLYNYEFVKQK